MEEEKIITWTELMLHTKCSSLWILIDGVVYDAGTYLAEHPGGDDILMYYGG
jgi:cytochrome b involved in lipid metabolism